jgi:opacity protein-like surface antigen
MDAGPYVGLGYGVFQIEDDGDDSGVNFSDTAPSYRLFAGYNIHETLAIEVGIGKSAGFNEQLVAFDPSIGVVELDLTVDYDVKTVRVLAVAPFSGIDMFGGIGFFDAKATSTLRFRSNLGAVTETAEASLSGGTIVGGVQFHLDRIVIRGEYEWFDDDEGIATSALNIAVIIPFGRR